MVAQDDLIVGQRDGGRSDFETSKVAPRLVRDVYRRTDREIIGGCRGAIYLGVCHVGWWWDAGSGNRWTSRDGA